MYAQRGTLVTNVFVVNSFGCSLPHIQSSSRKAFSNYLSLESSSVIRAMTNNKVWVKKQKILNFFQHSV